LNPRTRESEASYITVARNIWKLTSTTRCARYQGTTVCNNFRCCFVDSYWLYVLPEDDIVGIETG
jgi:hypothetical protein